MREQTKGMLLPQPLITIDLEQIYLVTILEKISWGGNIFLLYLRVSFDFDRIAINQSDKKTKLFIVDTIKIVFGLFFIFFFNLDMEM